MRPAVSEEYLEGELPADRAIRLSLAKAQVVAALRPDAVVIGSDQVAAQGTGSASRILDKPGNADNCRTQLASLSGAIAQFYSGCALIGPGERQIHLDTTTVAFRSLMPDEIDRYVKRERPFDCAGGFKAEALGITLFERIESQDPTALIGLPLIWLAAALRGVGYLAP
jgi:septum formation protein